MLLNPFWFGSIGGGGGGGGGGIEYVGGKSVAFPGTTSPTNVSLTDLTGGLDTAPSEGDIVIISFAFGSSGNFDVVIDTADYTEVADLYGNDSNDANLGVFYKVMGATPDTSVDLGQVYNVQHGAAAAIHVWRGVDTTTPLDVSSTTATGTNTGQANPPSITPSTPGSFIICCGGGGYVGGSTPFSSSDLSNFISVAKVDTFQICVGMGSFEWAGGAFDAAKWTGGSSATTMAWCACSLALRPA